MISKNIICPVCGASCDDIQVDYDGENITVKNACKMGNAKFQEIVSCGAGIDISVVDEDQRIESPGSKPVELHLELSCC